MGGNTHSETEVVFFRSENPAYEVIPDTPTDYFNSHGLADANMTQCEAYKS